MRNESSKQPKTIWRRTAFLRLTLLLSAFGLMTCLVAAWSPSDAFSKGRDSDVKIDATESLVSPQTTVLELRYDNRYMRIRNVFVRPVPWCGSKGMIPLQHYHGGSLNLNATTRSDIQLEIARGNLSKSSQMLANGIHSMTDEERQRFHQKVKAEARASQPLDPSRHLHILYRDSDIVVVHKPSGILCVPGPRRNPSLASLVHSELNTAIDVDKTVVHRLDMDTSGIVVFACSEEALSTLHDDFRRRRVQKTYEALVCGHVQAAELEIDLALERDPHHPPFMRVTQPKDITSVDTSVPAVSKFINQAPKSCLTEARVISWEFLEDCPVTRLELRPHTGRTHQLRVHCAAIGHAIIGDDIYGYNGEGAANGGLVLQQSVSDMENHRNLYKMNLPLCLHARQLCIHHPKTRAPMIFEVDPSF